MKIVDIHGLNATAQALPEGKRLNLLFPSTFERYIVLEAAIGLAATEQKHPFVIVDSYARRLKPGAVVGSNDFHQVRQMRAGLLTTPGLSYHIAETGVVWVHLPTATYAAYDFVEKKMTVVHGTIEEDREVGFEAPFVLGAQYPRGKVPPDCVEGNRGVLKEIGLYSARVFVGLGEGAAWFSHNLSTDPYIEFAKLIDTELAVRDTPAIAAS